MKRIKGIVILKMKRIKFLENMCKHFLCSFLKHGTYGLT